MDIFQNENTRFCLCLAAALIAIVVSGCDGGSADEEEPIGRAETETQRFPLKVARRSSPSLYKPSAAEVTAPVSSVERGRIAELVASANIRGDLSKAAEVRYTHPGVTLARYPALLKSALGEQVVDATSVGSRTVGDTETFTFAIDEEKGTLVLRNRRRDLVDARPEIRVEASVVEHRARTLLRALDLRLPTGSPFEVRGLMREDSNKRGQPEKVAYKIFAGLRLDGFAVQGPRIVLSYFMDGELHGAFVRWPNMRATDKSASLTEEQVVQRVKQRMMQHPLGAASESLEARVGFVAEAGEMRRVVLLTGMIDGADGARRWAELAVPM